MQVAPVFPPPPGPATDGLSEAGDPSAGILDRAGMVRILGGRRWSDPGRLADALWSAARRPQGRRDDLAVVVLRVDAPGP